MLDLNALLREQIQHAYSNAPAIQQIMNSAGLTADDIQTVDDLAKIPTTSKDKLQEMQQENPPFGGFLAVPLRDLKRIYMSPGPIYDPEGFHDEAPEAAAVEAFSASGFTADDIVLNTFLYHMVPAGLLLDSAFTTLGATVIPIGPPMGFISAELHIKLVLDLKPTVYAGTPSFLQILYEKAAEMGVPREAMSFKKAFFSAEPYLPAQRALFEGDYGLQTTQAYATADLGILGYEKPNQSGLFVPRNLIVQVCDPETGAILELGQPGEVVVTSLNKTYPLIRFGTGDLSIMELDGDHPKLLGLIGRSGEAVKVRGMFLHPNAIKAALAPFENIKKFQAVVGREGVRDTVALHLILTEGNINADEVSNAVKAAARLSVNSVEVVEEIEGGRLVRDTRSYT